MLNFLHPIWLSRIIQCSLFRPEFARKFGNLAHGNTGNLGNTPPEIQWTTSVFIKLGINQTGPGAPITKSGLQSHCFSRIWCQEYSTINLKSARYLLSLTKTQCLTCAKAQCLRSTKPQCLRCAKAQLLSFTEAQCVANHNVLVLPKHNVLLLQTQKVVFLQKHNVLCLKAHRVLFVHSQNICIGHKQDVFVLQK